MGTPSLVLFSPVRVSLETALARLTPIFRDADIGLVKISRLHRYAGILEVVDEDVICDDEVEAVKVVNNKKWEGLSLRYFIDPLWTDLWLYVWRTDHQLVVNCDITSQIIHYEDAGYQQGEWLERFLCSMVSALRPAACGFGTLYQEWHEILDPSAVVARLRAGDLWKLPSPHFHMIQETLLSRDDVDSSLGTRSGSPSFKVFRTTSGYLVVSDLP